MVPALALCHSLALTHHLLVIHKKKCLSGILQSGAEQRTTRTEDSYPTPCHGVIQSTVRYTFSNLHIILIQHQHH